MDAVYRHLFYLPAEFLRWQFEHVHVRPDTTGRGNDVLTKGENEELKIDGIIALAIAVRGMDVGEKPAEMQMFVVNF